MKIALITDQHFGVRGGSVSFSRYFEKFYSNVFFPYLEEHGIDTIIDLGDTFDKRKLIDFITLHDCRRYWFDEIHRRDMSLHVIVGNHCTAYKNTNEVNSPDLLLKEYPKVKVYSSPEEVVFDGVKIALLPWICSGNYSESIEFVNNTESQILFGHLELDGFEMYKGYPNEGGMSPSLFSKFDIVCSGHFHHRSSRGNITYLGSPYEMTWSDWNDERGFHIFDTDTRELTYIRNPYKMFHKIHYDDSIHSKEEVLDVDLSNITGSYVKVIIHEKKDLFCFDTFIDNIEKQHPLELQIVEDHLNKDSLSEEEISETEDTLTMLRGYVNSIDNEALDKKKLERLLSSLYEEALNLE